MASSRSSSGSSTGTWNAPPGTLAWRNRRERTRPWRVLTATLATTTAVLITLAAAGASPFNVITHLIFG